MNRSLFALGLALLLAPAAPAAPPKSGTYELAYRISGTESPVCLLKLEVRDGMVSGEVVATAAASGEMTLGHVTLDGDLLRFELTDRAGVQSFEGRLGKEGAPVLGSLERGGYLRATKLALTDKTELAPGRAARAEQPEAWRQALQMATKPLMLQARARQAKEAEEKEKLQKEAAAATEESRRELPGLYRAVLEKHPDTPFAVEAAVRLLGLAGKVKAPADEAGRWADRVLADAEAHGPRYAAEQAILVAEALNKAGAAYAPVAVRAGRRAEKALAASTSLERQSKVLAALAAALKNASDVDAGPVAARAAKIEAELDKEYLAKVPPFKPESFAGRKGAGDRIVALELFTGAECPPCVAADVAFDALEKSYKPTDLVLIQYHLHIPGPDPMTTPANVARWEYYRKLFANDVRGTPTAVFDGKPLPGGGSLAMSAGKYKQYREVIDKQLDEPAGAALTVRADRRGDTITVHAGVANLKEPGADKRLRLVLVEEAVRYVGGNKLRFHHMVVRAMPGGADGFPLTAAAGSHTAEVKLGDVRQGLTKYLDEYAETTREFPRPDRPLGLKTLKVIAFVQDDATGAILQAAATEVGGERAGK
jgi:hypothetical protein